MARARTPEARIMRHMGAALELLDELHRDDAIFQLGRMDGLLSHARLRLANSVRPEDAEDEDEDEERPDPVAELARTASGPRP